MTTLKEQIDLDLPTFVNVDEFAVPATVEGLATPVNGIFDPGADGERDPRSPAFTCIDAEIASVPHGAAVTILGDTYWIEGYRPDGVGMAMLILRKGTA